MITLLSCVLSLGGRASCPSISLTSSCPKDITYSSPLSLCTLLFYVCSPLLHVALKHNTVLCSSCTSRSCMTLCSSHTSRSCMRIYSCCLTAITNQVVSSKPNNNAKCCTVNIISLYRFWKYENKVSYNL
jgi:hypothetical protein